jgi:predicted TIM-barrel fold metal-dependent hydrolase
MADYKLFSADSHVSEPLDLWTTRLDAHLRDRAPHVERRDEDGKLVEYWVFEGFEPHRLSVGVAAAAVAGQREKFRASGGYADARPGGWDPVQRLVDQDVDGVDGEVLHTTLGFRLFWLLDAELQQACFRVYNDWLAEYCRHSPGRLVGLGLISLADVKLGVKELERCAGLGLKGAMIWNSAPDDRPYSSPEYDPFWAAAQELRMPVSFHALTGFHESRIPLKSVFFILSTYHEVERTLATVILSGVLERFPALQLVSVESQAGWIPYFLQRLDRAGKTRRDNFETRLTMAPREYFHRQVYATYIDDPQAIAGLEQIGADNLLWSSDYPHNASTWPRSQEVVERDFGHLAANVRRKVVRDNVRNLYQLDSE